MAFIADVLAGWGHFVAFFVDDAQFIGSERECYEAMAAFRYLCGQLGWPINEAKAATEGVPTSTPVFLGVRFNLDRWTVAVTDERLSKVVEQVREMIQRAGTVRVLEAQSLAGKLLWMSAVIPATRDLVQPMFGEVAGADRLGSRDFNMSARCRSALSQWLQRAPICNGSGALTRSIGVAVVRVGTDASGRGFGGFCDVTRQYFAGLWTRGERAVHSVNVRETACVAYGVALYAHVASGAVLRILVDNRTAFWALVRGNSDVPWVYFWTSIVFELQARFRFSLQVVWIPTALHEHADGLSRGLSPAAGYLPSQLPEQVRRSGFGTRWSAPSRASREGRLAAPPPSSTGISSWPRAWQKKASDECVMHTDTSVPPLCWSSSCSYSVSDVECARRR
jgi:hypothetical protein